MTSETEVITRLFISILLSGLIGLERKIYHKPAGFRTNILVGLGSTILMIISFTVLEKYSQAGGGDIGRIIGQIVTGIGFLGAGAIIQGRGSVHGLTTAASMWVVAAIGIAVGLGYFFVAISSTIAVLVVLVFMGRIEHRFEKTQDSETDKNLPI